MKYVCIAVCTVNSINMMTYVNGKKNRENDEIISGAIFILSQQRALWKKSKHFRTMYKST